MKRLILFAFVFIAGVSLFTCCKKQKEIKAVVKENRLEGDWQLFYRVRVFWGQDYDSLKLISLGLMCNKIGRVHV